MVDIFTRELACLLIIEGDVHIRQEEPVSSTQTPGFFGPGAVPVSSFLVILFAKGSFMNC